MRFTIHRHGTLLGEASLPLPGHHNVLNALASIAVALELEVPFELASEALANFGGVERRYQSLGSAADIQVVDDYAHHPTELRATLAAARSVHAGRIVSVFQPHRYTRTRDCMQEFATAFNDSDLVIISDIYPAGDAPIPGITGQALAEAIAAHGHKGVRFIGELDAIADQLPKQLSPGDLLLTLGAGDISTLGKRVLEKLSENASSTSGGDA